MYKVTMEIKLKRNLSLKESYEKIAALIRLFIQKNDKELKDELYKSTFSYYSFSNMFPIEGDLLYKNGHVYTVELRSLHQELLDMKNFSNLETDEMVILSASSGKLYYRGSGILSTETPVFFNTKPIKNEMDLENIKEKIRENNVFRYLKSGINQSDDIQKLRTDVIDTIKISDKAVIIPFQKKRLKNGKPYLYHCLHIEIMFKDNDLAKEAEKIIYVGGLGKNTSNGFGFMK